MKIFNTIANVADFVTDIYTTRLLYSNTKKAKTTLMVASVSMSALALGVSWYQTKVIMDNIKRESKELKKHVRGENS